jgi:ubiquinone/menaquinone biosynthesis C-methylase UbiE
MSNPNAVERANMPVGTNQILDRRTVENDNKNLLKWLKIGISVLDVGSGTGAITKGIADRVGPEGKARGIDTSENLIALARENFRDVPNLDFLVADINTYAPEEKYDLITSARVLQWLDNPQQVLKKMYLLLKPGGILSILDYNHAQIQWSPDPPAEMQRFYRAFLQWRQDAGFDNAIADHLAEMFEKTGLQGIQVEEQHELSQRGDQDFAHRAGIWTEVALHRGPQLVKDGYIAEAERLSAMKAYSEWVAHEGQSMRMYLLAVEGRRLRE